MAAREETWDVAHRLLDEQRFAVLSTAGPAGPYTSLVTFWATADLSEVIFPTLRRSHKFDFLVADPRVALLFDDRSNDETDIERAVAITATGSARDVVDETERRQAARSFLGKHPTLASFLDSPDCALVAVAVDSLFVVTRFQQVMELRPSVR